MEKQFGRLIIWRRRTYLSLVDMLRHRSETLKHLSLERKVSWKVFQFTVDLMTRHLEFPAARNSLYNTKDINYCFLQLSLRKGYAEGGLADLSLSACDVAKIHVYSFLPKKRIDFKI